MESAQISWDIAATPRIIGARGVSELLVARGLVSRNDALVAAKHADTEHLELIDAFVALAFVTENEAYQLLAEAAGVELMTMDHMTPSELAVRLVPEKLARRHAVVPLEVDNRTLTYATCEPFNPDAEADLSFGSGRRTRMVVATRSVVMEMIDRCYPKLHEVEALAERLRIERRTINEIDIAANDGTSSTVIDLCNYLIARAVETGASDVHIDCDSQGATVRYRISGVLEQMLTLPPSVTRPIRNRFKVMARADIAVQYKPQDGAFHVKVNGRPIHIRFSSLPTVDGEKLVLRVIDSMSPLQELERLGYDEETLTRLQRALAHPDGLVLLTGPTGSGKTTVLYAALGHLRTGRTNIVSVEDPVERAVPGVTQIPVLSRAGNSFAVVLRSLLRQDPNVIMVGEIRDAEVAQIVGQAAYTGHLVLSSLHTLDTATAITRLTNLGLEPFKIAESLRGVLAQRLVRMLCPHCKKVLEPEEAAALGEKHGLPSIAATVGPGCQQCRQTGYLGRMPVAELLTPSDELRNAIARGATAHEIRTAMRAAGYETMRDKAMNLVAQGVTTMTEIDRVLSADTEAEAQKRDRPRVLVVDDEPMTRMLIKLLLEREPFEVLEAENGRQAVDIAVRERPDLILIDLNMPEMDGYEAIHQMRREMALATVPILVLTAEEGPGVERRVLDLGADDYMLKPFEPTVLLSRVHSVFRRLKAVAA